MYSDGLVAMLLASIIAWLTVVITGSEIAIVGALFITGALIFYAISENPPRFRG